MTDNIKALEDSIKEDNAIFKDFYNYLDQTFDSLIGTNNQGLAYFRNILQCTSINVQTIVRMNTPETRGYEPSTNAWKEYISHMRRSFINDIWLILESYCREIIDNKNITLNSSYSKAIKHLDYAIDHSKQEEVINSINKAKNELQKGSFIPFTRYQKQILKLSIPKKNDRGEWENFLTCIREMRNSTHNNFILQEDINYTGRYFKLHLEKGKSVKLSCDTLKKIIKTFIEFYTILDKGLKNNTNTSNV